MSTVNLKGVPLFSMLKFFGLFIVNSRPHTVVESKMHTSTHGVCTSKPDVWALAVLLKKELSF